MTQTTEVNRKLYKQNLESLCTDHSDGKVTENFMENKVEFKKILLMFWIKTLTKTFSYQNHGLREESSVNLVKVILYLSKSSLNGPSSA